MEITKSTNFLLQQKWEFLHPRNKLSSTTIPYTSKFSKIKGNFQRKIALLHSSEAKSEKSKNNELIETLFYN
jgi:hypothetical protein